MAVQQTRAQALRSYGDEVFKQARAHLAQRAVPIVLNDTPTFRMKIRTFFAAKVTVDQAVTIIVGATATAKERNANSPHH